LVVIGVHTPEFSFEHEADNIHQSAKERHVDPAAEAYRRQAVQDRILRSGREGVFVHFRLSLLPILHPVEEIADFFFGHQ
jgi:hypothetical protein